MGNVLKHLNLGGRNQFIRFASHVFSLVSHLPAESVLLKMDFGGNNTVFDCFYARVYLESRVEQVGLAFTRRRVIIVWSR